MFFPDKINEKNICSWILHLFKVLALTKGERVVVQQVADVLLKMFSVLCVFIDFTDEADLPVGESALTVTCHFIALPSC